ncbi:MAG: hypothetical protein ACTIJ9_11170 [Aequorivita sp.]
MELSFEYFELLKKVNEEPIFVVMWAAFGVPLTMLVFTLLSALIPFKKIKTKLITVVLSILAITWLLGFVVTIILLFAEVSGIKLVFIWFALLISSTIFYAFNSAELSKWTDDIKETKKLNR